MNKDDTPFEFLDSDEISAAKATQQEEQQYKTICTECQSLMIRKVFDGVIDIITAVECCHSDSINIQEFPILECSHFVKAS